MTKSKAGLYGNRPPFRLSLGRADLAIAIGVSTSSIDVMVAEGALPPPRIWHSRKLWIVAEVEAHINEWPADGEDEPFNRIDAILDRRQPEEPKTGAGGYPIASGRKGDPLQDYYDRLGFDPATMGQAEMMELRKAAEEKWKASIPGTPLQKRERAALHQLGAHGPNVLVHWSKIKNCGPDTTERLKARGFLETTDHPKYADSVESLILTDAGYTAFKAL